MTTERFGGSVAWLADVDASALTSWLSAISLRAWPQQHKPAHLELKPMMVTDLAWHGFGAIAAPLVSEIMQLFPGCRAQQHMLSVVMPNDIIAVHRDLQPPAWRCRVHVPIETNEQSRFIVDREVHMLQCGSAYRVNTEAEHGVENDGTTPRVHFMFDVLLGA